MDVQWSWRCLKEGGATTYLYNFKKPCRKRITSDTKQHSRVDEHTSLVVSRLLYTGDFDPSRMHGRSWFAQRLKLHSVSDPFVEPIPSLGILRFGDNDCTAVLYGIWRRQDKRSETGNYFNRGSGVFCCAVNNRIPIALIVTRNWHTYCSQRSSTRWYSRRRRKDAMRPLQIISEPSRLVASRQSGSNQSRAITRKEEERSGVAEGFIRSIMLGSIPNGVGTMV